MTGKIDLIRKTDGMAREIVDFKTSDSKTGRREQTDLQMKLYAIGAVRSLEMQVEKCLIHFLGDDKVDYKGWNKNVYRESEFFLKDLINKIRMQKFEPRIEYCPYCDEFKYICPYYEGK